jgi:hypothetical protein
MSQSSKSALLMKTESFWVRLYPLCQCIVHIASKGSVSVNACRIEGFERRNRTKQTYLCRYRSNKGYELIGQSTQLGNMCHHEDMSAMQYLCRKTSSSSDVNVLPHLGDGDC